MTTAGLLFDAFSGVLFLGLGIVVAVMRPRRALNLWFGVYALGLGVLVLALNATHLIGDDADGRVAGGAAAAVTRLAGAAGGIVAGVGLCGIAWRVSRRHGSRATLAIGASFLALLVAAGTLPQVAAPWDRHPGLTTLGSFAATFGIHVAVRATGIAAALALALMATRAGLRAPREAMGLSFLSLGILPYAAFSTGDSLAFRAQAGATSALVFDLLCVAGLALVTGVWLRNARGAPGLRRPALLLALLAPLLLVAAAGLYFVDPTGNTGAAGAVRAASVIVLAYAIARHDLFGIQPHLQASLKRGTLTMAFAAAFLVGGKLGERVLAPPYDLVVSVAGMGALLLALDPLRRAADRVVGTAEHAMQESVQAERDGGPPALGALLQRRYRAEQRLGEGGQGFTYLCHDTLLDRAVVAKVIPLRPGASAHLEEAKRAAAIAHPSVVQVFDVGQDGAWGYIFMEYAPGGGLANRLGEPWSAARVAALAEDLLSAVGACHEAGIIHGDIKPDNILLDRDGRAKLADFGAARAIAPDRTARAGDAAGTLAYLAPEQVRGEPPSRAADLHACGVVLATAAAGRHPLVPPRADDFTVRHAILHAQPDLRGVPDALAAALRKALDKDPQSRYASAHEMLQALRRATPPQAANA